MRLLGGFFNVLRRTIIALSMCVLTVTSATAQDYVTSDGPLDDTAFYRLVACAAPPEQSCAKSFLRWDKEQISVGIVHRSTAYLEGKMKRVDASVVRALQRLNDSGMGLRLTRATTAPDIAIHLLDTARGDAITDSGAPMLDDLTLTNALTTLDVRGDTITRAWIAFSRDMSIRQYESVMLEEITQALGLLSDIRNPYYDSRSIFSQDADNSLKIPGAQDTIALRRHYPPR